MAEIAKHSKLNVLATKHLRWHICVWSCVFYTTNAMSGQKRIEPQNENEFKEDHVVWNILYNGGIKGFIKALDGNNLVWSRQVMGPWDEGQVQLIAIISILVHN